MLGPGSLFLLRPAIYPCPFHRRTGPRRWLRAAFAEFLEPAITHLQQSCLGAVRLPHDPVLLRLLRHVPQYGSHGIGRAAPISASLLRHLAPAAPLPYRQGPNWLREPPHH